MHVYYFNVYASLQIFIWNWGLTYFEELSKMWRNHYLPKLSVSLGLKCLLFRNSELISPREELFLYVHILYSCCWFHLCRYYKWILERNFHNLNKGVRGNQVTSLSCVSHSHLYITYMDTMCFLHNDGQQTVNAKTCPLLHNFYFLHVPVL